MLVARTMPVLLWVVWLQLGWWMASLFRTTLLRTLPLTRQWWMLVANNLTAQHCLGSTSGDVTGAMSKAIEAMGLCPAGHFDPTTTPITNPGYVNLKNAVYRAAHNTNSCLARAVNSPLSALSVGVGSPLFTFACASRSVKQRFGDFPNNIRAFSAIDACLSIIAARGEDTVFDTLFDISRYLQYRDSLLMDKVAFAENGTYFLSLPSSAQVVLSDGTAPSPAKADSVDKTLIGEAGWIALQYIQTCMAGTTLAGQKSLNSFRDTPTFTASQALVNVVNTGRPRTFSAAEAGMIARLLRAKSSCAVELGVVIASVANQADQSELRVLVTSMRSGTVALPAGTPWATAFPNASSFANMSHQLPTLAGRSEAGKSRRELIWAG